jgi:hypothetical protein
MNLFFALALLCVCLGVCASAMHTSHQPGTERTERNVLMERRIARDSFVKLGESDENDLHELVFAVKKLNLDLLEATVLERSTPGSALYQHWMSFHEVRGITHNPTASSKVLEWLAAHKELGVEVTWSSPYQDYIKATASVRVWGALLSAQFYRFDDRSKVTRTAKTTAATDAKTGAMHTDRYATGADARHKEGVRGTGIKNARNARNVGNVGNAGTVGTVGTAGRKHMHRCDEYYLPSALAPHLEAVLNTVQTPPPFKPQYRRKDTLADTDADADADADADKVPMVPRSHFRTDFTTRRVPTHRKKVQSQDVVTVSFLNAYYEISGVGHANLSQSVFETDSESFSPADLSQFQNLYGLESQAAEAPYGFAASDCVSHHCHCHCHCHCNHLIVPD